MAAPLLIIETGKPLPSLNRYGGFAHWIRVAAGLCVRQTRVVDVTAGQALPALAEVSGVVISGSAAYVTDRADWSETTAAWLRQAVAAGLPVLGICYGHQLLAHALGGEVAFNPAGRESGTIALTLHAEAADDPLFAGLPATLPAHATHLQTVLTPPPGATVLAQSARDNCQAFRIGERAWGVQFHPEFATHHMRGYLRERAECIARHGGDARQLARQVHAAPQARHLLRRFVRQTRLAA